MKIGKIFRFLLYVVSIVLIAAIGYVSYMYFFIYKQQKVDTKKYPHSIEYIDPEKSFLNTDFILCNEDFIVQYYNPKRATYSKGKNGLREFVLSNYKNRNYTDSGYLNIRFMINCKGEAGRYVIHENNLNLEPKKFNKDLVKQLLTITTQLKKWNPNYTHDAYRDSYMYISYRMEHGEITEILP